MQVRGYAWFEPPNQFGDVEDKGLCDKLEALLHLRELAKLKELIFKCCASLRDF